MTGQAWWGSSPYADFSQLFHLLLTSSLGEQPDSHGMEALREHVQGLETSTYRTEALAFNSWVNLLPPLQK